MLRTFQIIITELCCSLLKLYYNIHHLIRFCSFLALHILLNHIAAFVFNNVSLVFL